MLLTGLRMLLLAWSAVGAGRDVPGAEELPQSYFDQIAVHVKAGDWEKAKIVADELARGEPLRTSVTWDNLRLKLHTAATLGNKDPLQKQRRAEVAATVGLHDLALKYSKERIELLDPSSQDAYFARMDTAEIAKAGGVDAARRKDYSAAQHYFEMVAEYGVTWVRDLGVNRAQVISEFAKAPKNVAARINFAKNFWVGKSFGEGQYYSDAIRFLEETLASPSPISIEERKDIYMTVRSYSFADPAEMRMWEDRVLTEFPEDFDLVARIQVDRAQQAYAAKDLDTALQQYRHVCEKLRESASFGMAQFNVGMILEEQEKFEEAIGEFQKLLTSRVNDHDPTGNIMSEFRNYRARAQWEVGHCYRAMGRFDDALQAYVDTEKKYPFQSTCGNAHAEFAYRYALYQGLCHEHLGRQGTAAAHYLREIANGSGLYRNPTIHLRLLDLYGAVGKSGCLVKMLDAMDDRLQKRISKELKRSLDEETRERIRPSATIREAMRIRSLGAEHRWSDLIAMCRSKGTTAGPEEDYARMGNWQGVEAVKLMALYPNETVPLLIETARSTERPQIEEGGDRPDRRWLYFALGECGTEAALDYLEERAGVEAGSWPLNSIIFSMNLANDRGRERIEKLAATAQGNLESAIRGWREGRFGGKIDFQFPPLPRSANLPCDLNEIGHRE